MAKANTTTIDRLRSFMLDELGWEGSPEELTPDFPLIERGALDSLGIFQMVSFIEGEFGVEVRDEELVRENFGSLESIGRLVDSKRGG